MAENTVRFNLKNVYYSVYGIQGSATTPSFATPVAIPGAVSLDLSPEGEMTKFYADGIAYYTSSSNDGYSGSLEMARFPDAMLKDIWGYTEGTTSKVLTENANTNPQTFALLYQIDGDKDNELYVLYACTASRPGNGSKTKEGSIEVQTQSTDLTCVPMADGKVFARTTADTPSATKTGWFTSVFVEGA